MWPKKKTDHKKIFTGTSYDREKKLLSYGIGILLAFILVYFALILVVDGGNPLFGPTDVNYYVFYWQDDTEVTPATELLIPAIVNESGALAFSEEELSTSLYDCTIYNRPDRCNWINLSYVDTDKGKMISVRPAPSSFYKTRALSFNLMKENLTGNKFSPTPIISTSVFPPTVSTLVRNPIPEDDDGGVHLMIDTCGYNREKLFVCKGYSTNANFGFGGKRGLIPVTLEDRGQYDVLQTIVCIIGSPVYGNLCG